MTRDFGLANQKKTKKRGSISRKDNTVEIKFIFLFGTIIVPITHAAGSTQTKPIAVKCMVLAGIFLASPEHNYVVAPFNYGYVAIPCSDTVSGDQTCGCKTCFDVYNREHDPSEVRATMA